MEIRKIFPAFWLFILLMSVLACNTEEEAKETIVYDGPLLWGDSVRTLYSDSGIVRVIVESPKQLTFDGGDQEFPEGIFIRFFEPDGTLSATLKADEGYRFAEENRYTGIGNIVVEGLKEKNILLTDTLHWSPPEEKVYTKAPVTIIEELDTLRGKGLEAAQDFSTYTILQPEGSTILNEDPEGEEDLEIDSDEEN